jgi:hypothetical protein
MRRHKYEQSYCAAETLLHIFYLDPPLFEDAEKISSKIQQGNRETPYMMSMPPCEVEPKQNVLVRDPLVSQDLLRTSLSEFVNMNG